jgi:hypothetical protein
MRQKQPEKGKIMDVANLLKMHLNLDTWLYNTFLLNLQTYEQLDAEINGQLYNIVK